MQSLVSSELFCVIIGALIALISALIQNKNNFASSLDSEISKERIDAYKNIYRTVCKLNHNLAPYNKSSIPKDCFLGTVNGASNEYKGAFCFPSVFLSFDTLSAYKRELSVIVNDNRIFLHQSLLNRVCFLDSYIGEILQLSHDKDSNYLNMIGFTVNNEIAGMLVEIEKEIQYFFNHGKYRKNRTMYKESYDYENAHYQHTDLYSYIIKNPGVNDFGGFPLCENCASKDNCPLSAKSNTFS